MDFENFEFLVDSYSPSLSGILSLFAVRRLWLFYHFLKAYNDSFPKQNLAIKNVTQYVTLALVPLSVPICLP
jgi:hypothetical protein